jgi:hypothetical protein
MPVRCAGESQRFALIGTRVSRHNRGMKASMFVVVAVACGSSAAERVALPRFDNDYAGARVAALVNHVPIAVEIWAPW